METRQRADESGEMGTVKERPVQKRQRVIGEKLCQVCGDKALAHHFGALACETCKTFFHRNALKTEENWKCVFEGTCPIDKKTGRFCPPCRLKKCFDVGMMADQILDDEEHQEVLQKVNENHAKQAEMGTNGNTSNLFPGAATEGQTISSVHPENNVSADIDMSKPLPQVTKLDRSIVNCGLSSIFLEDVISPANQSLSQSFSCNARNHSSSASANNSVNSTTCVEALDSTLLQPASLQPSSTQVEEQFVSGMLAAFLSGQKHFEPFEHVPKDQLPSDLLMYWRLSEEERNLLCKLSTAYENTLLCVFQSSPPNTYLTPDEVTIDSYFQQIDAEVRSAIAFAKSLEDFRRLSREEQIALLKASTTEVLAIRACAVFITEKDGFLTPKGYFTLDHARMLCPDHPYLKLGTTYFRVMKNIVNNDFTLYALLHCVLLFDPSDDKVQNRQLVSSIADKYIILLRHYLESVYSFSHSEKYFTALLDKMLLYRDLSREGRPLIRKFFPNIPSQLLVEVLDLD